MDAVWLGSCDDEARCDVTVVTARYCHVAKQAPTLLELSATSLGTDYSSNNCYPSASLHAEIAQGRRLYRLTERAQPRYDPENTSPSIQQQSLRLGY